MARQGTLLIPLRLRPVFNQNDDGHSEQSKPVDDDGNQLE